MTIHIRGMNMIYYPILPGNSIVYVRNVTVITTQKAPADSSAAAG